MQRFQHINIILASGSPRRQEFLKEIGQAETGLSIIIKESYKLLNLISFFTAGETEARAWTIKKKYSGTFLMSALGPGFTAGLSGVKINSND